MTDIEIKLENMEIKPHQEIIGHITVNYSGLYDGVVINTQILGSNELVVWREYNGKKITQNVSRLFVNFRFDLSLLQNVNTWHLYGYAQTRRFCSL